MASIEELAARVTAPEAQVRVIREDAAAAQVSAGGADRDVFALGSKLDVLKALLASLRETQVEHGRKTGALERRLDGLEREVRSGFAKLAVGQSEILTLPTRLSPDGG